MMKSTLLTVFKVVCASAAVCLLVGCGADPSGVSVEGVVTNAGQPLSVGSVTFHADASKGNTSGTMAGAAIDEQGNYSIVAPAGWYKATVYATESQSEEGAEMYNTAKSLVAEQYTAAESTPLSIEVQPGASKGTYDLQLTK